MGQRVTGLETIAAAKIVAKLRGVLAFLWPYALCFLLGWWVQSYRLDAAKIKADRQDLKNIIATEKIRADAAENLLTEQRKLTASWQDRVDSADEQAAAQSRALIDLAARQPKDTVRIETRVQGGVNEAIQTDPDRWSVLRDPLPDSVLDPTIGEIEQSQNYGRAPR